MLRYTAQQFAAELCAHRRCAAASELYYCFASSLLLRRSRVLIDGAPPQCSRMLKYAHVCACSDSSLLCSSNELLLTPLRDMDSDLRFSSRTPNTGSKAVVK